MARTTAQMRLSIHPNDKQKGTSFKIGDYQDILKIAADNDLTDAAHRILLEFATDTGAARGQVWFDDHPM